MSRSVIIPIRRSPSVTGMEPASALSMKDAASCTGWSGRTVCTSRVITSLIFIVALLSRNPGVKTNSRRAPFRGLRHVFRQQVVSRNQLVTLIENLHRPADDAGLFALQRLRPNGQLHAHRIAGIERRQEPQILEPGVGQNRP